MADKTASEPDQKPGESKEILPDDPTPEATVHSGPNDPARTEATDTRAPEEKDEKKAPAAPVEQSAANTGDTEEKPKSTSKTPAKRAAAKPASKTEEKTETPASTEEKPKAAARPKKEWTYEAPDPSLTTRIQRALGRHGFYYGPADGKFEDKSRQGVQRALQLVGYEGAINGHIGEEQAKLIQTFAKKHGTYVGPINKKVDTSTWAGFAVALERLP